MSRLTYGAYGASAYDLPNILIGTYKSKGYFIKNRIHELNIGCKINQPTFNTINLANMKDNEEIVFCGRIHHAEYFDNYDAYKIIKSGSSYEISYYNGNKIEDDGIVQNGEIVYNPCSFRIKFIAIINGTEQISYLKDCDFKNENFRLTTDANGNCTLKDEKIIGNIFGATSFRYEIEFMTNDDKKTYYLDNITFFGTNKSINSNIRQGYLVFDFMKYLNPTADNLDDYTITDIDILNISYDSKNENDKHEIYVASKIYYDEESVYGTRWSSRYLNNQNKVHLISALTNNTAINDPLVLYYDPCEHVDNNESNNYIDYKIKSLIVGGGVVKKNPEEMNGVTYYSNINGDIDKDDFVNGESDYGIMSPTDVYIGYKEYVSYQDLNQDGIVNEIDRNIIRGNIDKVTLLKGGYIAIKIFTKGKELLKGPLYIYEEDMYRLDLEDYNQPIIIEFYFNRFYTSYESPYIHFIGIETYNEYQESIGFGPSKRYQCELNSYYLERNNGVLTFIDKNDDNKIDQDLVIKNLDFNWPYWFTSTSLENIQENAIQIVTDEEFVRDNPNVELSIDYSTLWRNNIVGEIINDNDINSELQYRGHFIETKNEDVLSVKELLEHYPNIEYYHIGANLTSKITITCKFYSEIYSFIYSGICKKYIKNDEWDEISLKMVETNLNPFKKWLYVIRLNTEQNKQQNVKLFISNIEDGQDIIKTDILDKVGVACTEEAIGKSAYNQYIYEFVGTYNLGGLENNYGRDILASEIPLFEKIKADNLSNFTIQSDVTLKNYVNFNSDGKLQYIAIAMDDDARPRHYLNTKGVETNRSTVKTIKKNGNTYADMFISYDDLSKELKTTINKDSIIEIDHRTNNTLVTFEHKPDGILFIGREKYDLRKQWVPRIKSGYYNIGKSIRFFNPDSESIRLKNIYPSTIMGLLKTSGPYGTMGHKNDGLKNHIVNPSWETTGDMTNDEFYLIYRETYKGEK